MRLRVVATNGVVAGEMTESGGRDAKELWMIGSGKKYPPLTPCLRVMVSGFVPIKLRGRPY